MLLSGILLLSAALPPTQSHGITLPEGVVASWQGGSIQKDRFERFLGRSFHQKKLGMDALAHILQVQLVEQEAEKRRLHVSEEDFEIRMNLIRTAAAEAGVDLVTLVQARRMTMVEFKKLIKDSIYHEMLVREDLKLPKGADVAPDQLQEWSNQHTQKLLAQSASAPEGYALDAPPFVVTEAELGKVLHEILPASRLSEYVEQLALQSWLPRWAKEQGLVLTDDILEAEIQWRRQRVAENPAYGGATYEALLSTQGSTVESVRAGAELRAAAYLRIYAQTVFSDAWFEGQGEKEMQRFQEKYGAKRQVSWLLLRGVKEKQNPVDLTFEEAAEELHLYAKEIRSESDFAKTAGAYSEDEVSRRRDGILGWIAQVDPGADYAFAQAAFQAKAQTLFGPVRTKGGQALGWVHEIQPAPEKSDFYKAVRRGFHKTLRQQLLVTMNLQSLYVDPLAGIPEASPEMLR
ncbi:MAG: peptidylprolyl isomerase [Planctomycetota bacterium]|nr:peptidylprolyl isomerase [Planctomycetota bacterium]